MSRDDDAVMDLCSRVFADPSLLDQTITHAVDGPFHFEPHAHDDLLQLDLIDGCDGRCWCDKHWHGVGGRVLLASHPKQDHGYELRPGRKPSRVYHLRLRVQPGWQVVRRRVFPRMVSDAGDHGSHSEALIEPLRNLMKSDILRVERPPRVVAHLAEVLCLWPRRLPGQRRVPLAYDEQAVENLDSELADAIRLIHKRTDDPPTLEELAHVTCVSTRHFARLFHDVIGCSPHAYITARRFTLARELLLQNQLRVHQIARRLGFSSSATFSRWFTQHAGMSPRQFSRDPAVL